MNVNMNLNMDSTPHPFNPPASSTAPYNTTIPSATATAPNPSNPLLFSSPSANTTTVASNPALNPNPHHAPAVDPLHHLQHQHQQLQPGVGHTETSVAPAPGTAESQAPGPGPGLVRQSSATTYPHQIEGAGGPTATAPFLRDFSLVAEAAKRAQMSVVMRDLESVTL
ncbi:hypothetical protein P170DRAFT_424150 [Aspergillus steynii IBT 23096]|uniref:Uncharacterized protein n=1 Tax=Aspergillus steynii IBT 23096 TaxID=1392250 RepID=A0A2I2GKK2_9EURO|nr:uncharacterized protein P170DRAFT_424150 [Aspergillus steynii IBT 23096]PLB53410.1 hypothetical protein P170DRAFT_424150 [Aspergillus steynii IBT 23096]